MIRGIYSAANAMDAAVQNQEVVAHNLAHATVPGFRQRGLAFALPDATPGHVGSTQAAPGGRSTPSQYVDFRPGALQHTGAPLDLAIDGNAFFTLQGPDGPIYTRNGTFRLNTQGQVVSQGGYPLQGAGGTITVPPGATDVTVARDGSVSAGGQPIGRIQLAGFQDLSQLDPVGPTLFRAGPKAGLQTAAGGVVQGYRETSNVQPAEAMVAMIAGARHFEASQRALRAIAEAVQLNTRPQS
jgi:flagellar basal-body rod protein FlgF/flagellar basal-body rod protein FlgG